MDEISNFKRLTAIKEILFELTGEDHYLSISDILHQLKLRFGSEYNVSRNTIIKAIEELKNCEFNIEEYVGENKTAYYSHQYRKFELHELRLLIDAISSARFITSDESNKLINKVRALTSKHLAKRLHNQVVVDQSVKGENREVRYHIDKIHTCINEKKRLTFQYGRYNLKKEFLLIHEGQIYDVTPLALVWNNDYYYLVAQPEGKDEIKHFRVDRMKNVVEGDPMPSKIDFDITEHLKRSFNMYPGIVNNVEVQFKNQLINVVIDRFGRNINIRKVNEDWFVIKMKASISEGLVRWLLTWGSDAKVIEPSQLVKKLKAEAEKMQRLYS